MLSPAFKRILWQLKLVWQLNIRASFKDVELMLMFERVLFAVDKMIAICSPRSL